MELKAPIKRACKRFLQHSAVGLIRSEAGFAPRSDDLADGLAQPFDTLLEGSGGRA